MKKAGKLNYVKIRFDPYGKLKMFGAYYCFYLHEVVMLVTLLVAILLQKR